MLVKRYLAFLYLSVFLALLVMISITNNRYQAEESAVQEYDSRKLKVSSQSKHGLRHSKWQKMGQTVETYPTLSSNIMKNITTFVFFIGYPRSGHSIVGSILDAHPHVVLSHELKFIQKWSSIFQADSERDTSSKLFNKIYRNSVFSRKTRTKNTKGYSLEIHPSWQGSYDKYVEVIGDKSAGDVVIHYLRNRAKVKAQIVELMRTLPIAIKALHVIRNPYDIITTGLLYFMKRRGGFIGSTKVDEFVLHVKNDFKATGKKLEITNKTMFQERITKHFEMVKAVSDLTSVMGRNQVLDIHYKDLVHQPEETILTMMNFLGVSAEKNYIQVCTEKIFKMVARSRDLIEWPDEFRRLVEEKINENDSLMTYSFTSD